MNLWAFPPLQTERLQEASAQFEPMRAPVDKCEQNAGPGQNTRSCPHTNAIMRIMSQAKAQKSTNPTQIDAKPPK